MGDRREYRRGHTNPVRSICTDTTGFNIKPIREKIISDRLPITKI